MYMKTEYHNVNMIEHQKIKYLLVHQDTSHKEKKKVCPCTCGRLTNTNNISWLRDES